MLCTGVLIDSFEVCKEAEVNPSDLVTSAVGSSIREASFASVQKVVEESAAASDLFRSRFVQE